MFRTKKKVKKVVNETLDERAAAEAQAEEKRIEKLKERVRNINVWLHQKRGNVPYAPQFIVSGGKVYANEYFGIGDGWNRYPELNGLPEESIMQLLELVIAYAPTVEEKPKEITPITAGQGICAASQKVELLKSYSKNAAKKKTVKKKR